MRRTTIANNLTVAKILSVASVGLLLGVLSYAVFHISNYWITAMSSCSTCSEGITKTIFNANHLFLVLLGGWALFGILKVVRFLIHEYRFLQSIKKFTSDDSGVYFIEDANFAAWSGGVFAHSICIDQTFWRSLSADERKALIAHESCHIEKRDALLFFLLGITESAISFPFVSKFLRNLSKRIKLQSEYTADTRAINATSKTALASLLHKALLFETHAHRVSPGIDSEIHERVKLLTAQSTFQPLSKADHNVAFATLMVFGFLVAGLSLNLQPIAHCFIS